jgi:hypothetical protein
MKQSLQKYRDLYFHSREAIARSMSAILGTVSLVFLATIWIVAMVYAFEHNGIFPEINWFYFVYCPSVVLALTLPIYIVLDHSLWLDSLRNPAHR